MCVVGKEEGGGGADLAVPSDGPAGVLLHPDAAAQALCNLEARGGGAGLGVPVHGGMPEAHLR